MGGGMYVGGGRQLSCSTTLTLSSNSANYGGGMFVDTNTPVSTYLVSADNNEATNNGGAFYLRSNVNITYNICMAGMYWDGSRCMCNSGTNWDRDSCITCPSDKPYWNGSSCTTCPADTPYWNGNACVNPCSSGLTWNGSACVCPTTYWWYEGRCNTCNNSQSPFTVQVSGTRCNVKQSGWNYIPIRKEHDWSCWDYACWWKIMPDRP